MIFVLKLDTVLASLTFVGKEFQIVGAEYVKLRLKISVLGNGTFRLLLDALLVFPVT